MAWNPFSFDSFDGNLPDITTDNTIDNGIVTAETLADDDTDSELFKSYQLTKEGANPFSESDDILDDVEDDDSIDEHCGKCGEDDVEECDAFKCKKEDSEDLDEEELSPFEEADLIMMDIAEAVLDDGEDDLIADDVDDMVDEDDEEIDADAEGINEIEADILDDEEDDLIDMAMEAEE